MDKLIINLAISSDANLDNNNHDLAPYYSVDHAIIAYLKLPIAFVFP